eukprot:TRINITY_DN133_c0_g1_i1.p1 TRINITY_DN133_c0_g1~~TRINITY_DN133_c0_g1_i1.p1  ORF type:complete len:403 (-),score=48.71 TRINITY_DN133_c0_g1_i1:37-1245(-)
MKSVFFFWSLLFFFCLSLYTCPASNEAERHSALAPFGIPYWTLGGDAYATENYIRLAEDRQSKKGWLWNTIPCYLTDWQVTFRFRVHGVGNVGADGIAFWYTEGSHTSGDLFGNQANFKGIGIILDTYDNDGSGLHPYLSMISHNGRGNFKQHHDHAQDEKENLGGCTVQVRQLKNPSAIRIDYSKGHLQVSYSLDDSGSYRQCFSRQIDLPQGYFFGFSANTGHLADNHDIYSFDIFDNSYRGSTAYDKENLFSSLLSGLLTKLKSLGKRGPATIEPQSNDKSHPKLNALSVQVESLQADLERLRSVAGKPSGRSSDDSSVCSAVGSELTQIQKFMERVDKDHTKKQNELKQLLGQISREVEYGGAFDVFGLLQLLVLFALIIFAIVVYLIYDEDKRKRHF